MKSKQYTPFLSFKLSLSDHFHTLSLTKLDEYNHQIPSQGAVFPVSKVITLMFLRFSLIFLRSHHGHAGESNAVRFI